MKHLHRIRLNRTLILIPVVLLGMLVLGLLITVTTAAAQGSPFHPTFPFLDADGTNVLESGKPVSTVQTCGACHDTTFIVEHNAHEGILTGQINAPAGEAIMIDPVDGTLTILDESAASTEMNCFLCHVIGTNNTARLEALSTGRFEWANTATLLGTGVVEQSADGYTWNPDAFDANGELLQEYVTIQDPAVENCAQCHGMATTDAVTPLVLDACATTQRATITTGQVFAPQRIMDSGLNITGKEDLSRAWDVHAERVVACTDCHYSLNNPAYAAKPNSDQPDHLVFDPRRLDPGEYLLRPLHELARSEADTSANGSCTACHDAQSTHQWLPYADRHFEALACETCHIPNMPAPARETYDWTVLAANRGPVTTCRGIEVETPGDPPLIVGAEPALLSASDNAAIAPYNLVTTWYWVSGDPAQPVNLADLQAAYFDGSSYHVDVLAAFDADGSGDLDSTELIIDSAAKQAVIADRLAGLGLTDPHIEASVEAYPISHGVAHGDWAVRDCQTCHGDDSRLAQPIALAGNLPGGVIPSLDGAAINHAEITLNENGTLFFQSQVGNTGTGTYVFGFSSSRVIDWIGVLLFLGVLAGVTVHGGLRFLAVKRRGSHAVESQEVYMYGVYERLWHWLQTTAIFILIITGLIIHKPDMFGVFSFRGVVQVHNILAVILIINAALSLFYHLASGEIRQFLPRPAGFFDQAIQQALYYLRGIFRGEAHPFEKTPDRKLNPLQQIVYLGLLNVLLPLQIITGAMMWGAQRWPELAARLGGLPFLAPFHTLVAWMLASFIVMHVYLTTTGPTPLASIKGMIMGWDEVEAPSSAK